jgi:acetyl esterase/lipase
MFGTNREFCSIIAARTKCLVFDADYRKAPEHPFPAVIQDAEDIIFYLIANPDKYDPPNIFLSGFSAGGSIALVMTSTLGPDRIKGVIGFYPAVDLTKQHTAPEQRMLAGVTVSPFFRNIARAAYIPSSQPRNDPRISVTHAPTKKFPKHIYLVCGNADAGYDPLAKFTEKLKEAGHRDIEFVSLVYMGHGFDARAKKGTEAEKKKVETYAGAVDLINRVIGASR